MTFSKVVLDFFLQEVFKFCITRKIATLVQLQTLVDCFYYGELWKRNAPSKLSLDKKNLGQNASQTKCLILHLPYILFDFKNELKSIWLAVELMLQIIQILLSTEVNENDLNRLSEQITAHLQCCQLFFNLSLKPKHHFLLHYVRVIKLMGPVVRFWALRLEAKHQNFKRTVRTTNNFINIKKTLAYKHQERFFDVPFCLEDELSFGKKTDFIECPQFGTYCEQLKASNFSEEELQMSCTAKSLKLNDRVFKSGFLLACSKQFYEIHHILEIRNEVLFLCNRCYEILSYESFLNSLHIQPKEEVKILNLRTLQNNKPYEKRFIFGPIYVIVDNLDTLKMSLN